MRRTALLTLVMLSSLLSGCGFHLRGSYDLPPQFQQIYVSSTIEFSELSRHVKDRLRINQVEMLSAPDQQHPHLMLLSDKLEERDLSLVGDGLVVEYELLYTVSVGIDVEGEERIYQDFVITRDYQDDPNKALAKAREKRLLITEMRQQAADMIVRYLASLA